MTRNWRTDEGNALVEFVYLAVLLLVPLVYVLMTVFLVQRAAFGATEAARQAGRAYARSASISQAQNRGTAAARLVLRDQGITAAVTPRYQCLGGCLVPGSRVRVTVTYLVKLPVLGSLFGSDRAGVRVQATHTEYVDTYKSGS